ncbi:MAG TPA: 7-carboxy-7-deazaguanine synthase QueE [Caldithrix abyssi]|uniref:7-carboxy-7-deazaguanine synthase n=1 Tax=Caldithrix abyssi TaxID=187145 RepID=A0A7V4U2H4_CALAY|nr:7-carboxy-7-deazaguanine synthase QueE [Caldithrix abyssi]
MQNTLKINEIFYSIQGESTFAGRPCIFVRLTYCNLRCTYCDTEYAFHEGEERTLQQIMQEIKEYACDLVEITGGEPLIQKNVYPLMTNLADAGYTVLLETGGHLNIAQVDPRVRRIVDIKCPSSGESDKVHWDNIALLTDLDEVKFVIGDREDYEWAKAILEKYNLNERCPVLFAPVFGQLKNKHLAEWILEDRLNVRFQLQMHKYIWPPEQRGV